MTDQNVACAMPPTPDPDWPWKKVLLEMVRVLPDEVLAEAGLHRSSSKLICAQDDVVHLRKEVEWRKAETLRLAKELTAAESRAAEAERERDAYAKQVGELLLRVNNESAGMLQAVSAAKEAAEDDMEKMRDERDDAQADLARVKAELDEAKRHMSLRLTEVQALQGSLAEMIDVARKAKAELDEGMRAFGRDPEVSAPTSLSKLIYELKAELDEVRSNLAAHKIAVQSVSDVAHEEAADGAHLRERLAVLSDAWRRYINRDLSLEELEGAVAELAEQPPSPPRAASEGGADGVGEGSGAIRRRRARCSSRRAHPRAPRAATPSAGRAGRRG